MELWRLILAYLPLPDLGRCCQVCRAWRELILSLDNTRWRQLCLGCPESRHPNWPSQPHLEPPSWREALKQHAIATRTWTQNGPELQSSACLYFLRRRKDRKVWHVGPGCELETLRSALVVAGPYDRVVLHPGVYEEQAEVVMKVPVELVGLGRLGEVALLACIEQQCPTARLCNLVFMPPWFSTVVYKVKNSLFLRYVAVCVRSSELFFCQSGAPGDVPWTVNAGGLKSLFVFKYDSLVSALELDVCKYGSLKIPFP